MGFSDPNNVILPLKVILMLVQTFLAILIGYTRVSTPNSNATRKSLSMWASQREIPSIHLSTKLQTFTCRSLLSCSLAYFSLNSSR